MCPPSVLLLKCPPSSKSHPWEVPTLVLPPAAFYQWPPHLGGFTTSPEKREGLFATGEPQPPRSTDGNTKKFLEINLYVFMKECTIVIDAWEVKFLNWRSLWPFGFLQELCSPWHQPLMPLKIETKPSGSVKKECLLCFFLLTILFQFKYISLDSLSFVL